MKVLVIVFWILFGVFLTAWYVFDFYVYKVPAFKALNVPFLWLWIGSLILSIVFSILFVIKEFSKHKNNDD